VLLGLLFSTGVRAQSFSVSPGGGSGLPADDIFLPGPTPVVPGLGVNVDALSYGRSVFFMFDPSFALEFSVAPFSVGLPGTAVAAESAGAGLGPGDEPADIFLETGTGLNLQVLDGDAVPNPGVGGVPGGLGLIEPFPASGDNVDGWDNRPPAPFGAGSIFFSYDLASAGGLGFVGADIFEATPIPPAPGPPFYDSPAAPGLYAPAAALSLDSLGAGSDEVDALIVYEDGTPGFTAGDIILLSLSPGSLSLGAGSGTPYAGFGAADIFAIAGPGGPVGLHRSAAALGLAPFDDVDALDSTMLVIPEPSTVLMLALGVAALACRRNRRSH
jgi:hypothetical protein